MKYTLLTKEQFENLHHEFAVFLASQQIDSKEWIKIKTEKPAVALEEMQLFSEVVWEDVLMTSSPRTRLSSRSELKA